MMCIHAIIPTWLGLSTQEKGSGTSCETDILPVTILLRDRDNKKGSTQPFLYTRLSLSCCAEEREMLWIGRGWRGGTGISAKAVHTRHSGRCQHWWTLCSGFSQIWWFCFPSPSPSPPLTSNWPILAVREKWMSSEWKRNYSWIWHSFPC